MALFAGQKVLINPKMKSKFIFNNWRFDFFELFGEAFFRFLAIFCTFNGHISLTKIFLQEKKKNVQTTLA